MSPRRPVAGCPGLSLSHRETARFHEATPLTNRFPSFTGEGELCVWVGRGAAFWLSGHFCHLILNGHSPGVCEQHTQRSARVRHRCASTSRAALRKLTGPSEDPLNAIHKSDGETHSTSRGHTDGKRQISRDFDRQDFTLHVPQVFCAIQAIYACDSCVCNV